MEMTRNISSYSDEFKCEACGTYITGYSKAEYDEDADDTVNYEYEFKYCPECGRKVEE